MTERLALYSFYAFCYILPWSIWSLIKPKPDPGIVLFEIFERSNITTTLRNPSRFNGIQGLFYATFSFLGLPFFIWRYGIYRALGLTLTPTATALGIAFIAGFAFDLTSETKTNISTSIPILLRSVIGVYISVNDLRFRRCTLINRGWKNLCSYKTISAQPPPQRILTNVHSAPKKL